LCSQVDNFLIEGGFYDNFDNLAVPEEEEEEEEEL
jgi:hypothetical protein